MNLTDEQIDRLSAESIGLRLRYDKKLGMFFRSLDKPDSSGVCTGVQWNPRHSNDDSARLSDVHDMGVDLSPSEKRALAITGSKGAGYIAYYADHNNDKSAARRYAVAMVAAMVQMRKQEESK